MRQINFGTRMFGPQFFWIVALVALLGSAQANAQGFDLQGEWKWSIASGRYTGKWVIDNQTPDGHFTGHFVQTNAGDAGTILGRVTGNRVEFTRSFTMAGQAQEQRYQGRLEMNGTQMRMVDGTWDGAYALSRTPDYLEFHAELIVRSAPVATFAGRWKMNADGFEFVLELEQQRDVLSGSMTSANRALNSEPPSKVEGAVRGREVVFRRITPGLLTQEFRGYIFNRSDGKAMGGIFEFRNQWTYGWFATR
jgi:hypothetical protein